MNFLLGLLFLISFSSASVVKCAITAPYNPHNIATILSIKDAAMEGMAWYLYKVAMLFNNIGSLPCNKVESAMDHFMEVYCQEPFFDGYVGVLSNGILYTNRSDVRKLYKDSAMRGLVIYPFHENVHNPFVSNINIGPLYYTVSMNITTFDHLALVKGYYQAKWLIDPLGNLCMSGMTEII